MSGVLDELKAVLSEIPSPALQCNCAYNYPNSWPFTACPYHDDKYPRAGR